MTADRTVAARPSTIVRCSAWASASHTCQHQRDSKPRKRTARNPFRLLGGFLLCGSELCETLTLTVQPRYLNGAEIVLRVIDKDEKEGDAEA